MGREKLHQSDKKGKAAMIKNLNIEYSEEIIEEVIMTALEAQFKNSALCLTKREYTLHKRTEIALFYYYKRITDRIKNRAFHKAMKLNPFTI